jgi:hypothetical protein
VFTPDKIFLRSQTFQEKAKRLSRATLGQAPALPAEKTFGNALAFLNDVRDKEMKFKSKNYWLLPFIL